MPIRNITTGSLLPYLVKSAETPLSRMIGLLSTDKPDTDASVYFAPCYSIHTIGMRYPIDILFLDKEQKLIKLFRNLPPNRLTGTISDAHSVLEFPGGTFTGAEINDLLEVKPDVPLSINLKGFARLFYLPVIILATISIIYFIISLFI
jgi:uncharacterized protein